VKLTILNKPLSGITEKLFITGMFEGDDLQGSEIKQINDLTSNALENAFNSDLFSGKNGQSIVLTSTGSQGPSQVLLVGLGKRKKITEEKIRRAFGDAGKFARGKGNVDVVVLPLFVEDDSTFVIPALEGVALAMYRFVRHSKNLDKKPILNELKVIAPLGFDKNIFGQLVHDAEATITGNYFARDLATMPGMDLYPESYGNMAKELAGGDLKVEVIPHTKLEEMGMGALLAVGQGSAHKPVLIHMIYDPDPSRKKKTLALIGKGVTFDSGGLDIKPAAGMRDMKIDMAGSAAVMGIFKVLNQWKPDLRVEGFIGAAENMTGSFAYRPGDILTSYKGLTIEVDNTDAEGRLTMADALAYAVEKANPDAIIDLATLTGACWIALGHHATGLMGTSNELRDLLAESGTLTGERVWELPLWDEYSEQIKSEVADMKNTGGRPGGASTAGAFLKEYVDDVPWVHLDIAGTASEVPVSYVPHKELATGVGVRLLLDFMRRWQ